MNMKTVTKLIAYSALVASLILGFAVIAHAQERTGETITDATALIPQNGRGTLDNSNAPYSSTIVRGAAL